MLSKGAREVVGAVILGHKVKIGLFGWIKDGLYGSRALARRMKKDGTFSSLRALVLVDMIADRNLDLSIDLGSDAAAGSPS